MANSSQLVAEKWSRHAPSPQDQNFNMSPVFSRHKIATAFGPEYVEEFKENPHFAEDIFVKKFLEGRKIETILSLCCGFGRIERRIVSKLTGRVKALGVDIAEGALQVARVSAEEEGLDGLSYICADLNSYEFGKEMYDVIIAYGALHHLSNLNDVLDRAYRCLKPGGLLYSHEYVGLPFYECSPRQLQLVNAIAYLVPPELRLRRGMAYARPRWFARIRSMMHQAAAGYFDERWPKWKKLAARLFASIGNDPGHNDFGWVALSPHDLVKRTDPSEGVSAPYVVEALRQRFERVEVMSSGGALLEHALDSRFYQNFDIHNPLHVCTADMLWNIERRLSEMGVLGLHNVYIVAHKGK